MGFAFSSQAFAKLELPQNLTSSDRQEALRIIGLGTSAKILTNPYALGGYHGIEFGIALESIPTEDVSRLGSRLPNPQAEVTIPKLTVGKGLYSNLDFFIHFMPYNQNSELSQYGGVLRWGFYEASSIPISANITAHMNFGNINNQLTTKTYGADLIGAINVNEVALYAG
ncbi:MAG: hypothetical protein RBT63_04620, partial [Bdellovibrionales bacterium]|nr:hypothetical protein [Bdellovibrionales bacterium]